MSEIDELKSQIEHQQGQINSLVQAMSFCLILYPAKEELSAALNQTVSLLEPVQKSEKIDVSASYRAQGAIYTLNQLLSTLSEYEQSTQPKHPKL